MHGKSATLASCEKRNTWTNQVANKLTSMDSRYGGEFIIVHHPQNCKRIRVHPLRKERLPFFTSHLDGESNGYAAHVCGVCLRRGNGPKETLKWMDVYDCFFLSPALVLIGTRIHANRTNNTIQYNTIQYIATTLLSNIAMRTHLPNKKYVLCMDVWAVGHPQTPSRGSEKTWPWSSVIPLPRVAHVVSNPSHQAPA